jgi:hypothetical protein
MLPNHMIGIAYLHEVLTKEVAEMGAPEALATTLSLSSVSRGDLRAPAVSDNPRLAL